MISIWIIFDLSYLIIIFLWTYNKSLSIDFCYKYDYKYISFTKNYFKTLNYKRTALNSNYTK